MYADRFERDSRAVEYVRGRGLEGVRRGARLGFVGDNPLPGDEQYLNHLAIPYVNAVGRVVGMRFRRLWGDGPKYLQRHGEAVPMYRPWGVLASPEAHIAEGELDTLSLVAAGLPACGLPGASTWKDWFAPLFDGCERVFVWADGDEAGDRLFGAVSASLPFAVRVNVPRGEDVNSLLVSGGKEGVLGLVR